MIIHKPSFSADLGMSKLPPYLLLAVCAVAAPLSKSKSVLSKASHPRLAGVPFFQDALALMFDNSGRLLCEPSVSTAQALCLLEMHEIAASHSWTSHFRYFGAFSDTARRPTSRHRARSELEGTHLTVSPLVITRTGRPGARGQPACGQT